MSSPMKSYLKDLSTDLGTCSVTIITDTARAPICPYRYVRTERRPSNNVAARGISKIASCFFPTEEKDQENNSKTPTSLPTKEHKFALLDDFQPLQRDTLPTTLLPPRHSMQPAQSKARVSAQLTPTRPQRNAKPSVTPHSTPTRSEEANGEEQHLQPDHLLVGLEERFFHEIWIFEDMSSSDASNTGGCACNRKKTSTPTIRLSPLTFTSPRNLNSRNSHAMRAIHKRPAARKQQEGVVKRVTPTAHAA